MLPLKEAWTHFFRPLVHSSAIAHDTDTIPYLPAGFGLCPCAGNGGVGTTAGGREFRETDWRRATVRHVQSESDEASCPSAFTNERVE